MTPKDLIQCMVDDLERKSPVDIADVSVKIQHSEKAARAEVAKFVDGKWIIFEVLARPIGISEGIEIGA